MIHHLELLHSVCYSWGIISIYESWLFYNNFNSTFITFQSGFKGGRIDVIERVEDDEALESDEDEENLLVEKDTDTNMDPRPGCVDVILPVIKIDPERYIQVLLEIKKEINRKSDNLSKLLTK